ncbi:MAG: hypothetical protein M8866_09130 [marine benthic group bacterium]|nr:hypothetical protein [Candidatus Benthicola marisminoris]
MIPLPPVSGRPPIRAGLLVLLAALSWAAPARAQVDPSLLAGMSARSIGPAGMSGRVADVVAAPSDPTIVYVGAATGGVWKSLNGGLSFEPVFDDQPVAAIGAIAIHPTDPDVVWVGTGEGNVRNSVSVGNGIYRTRDGGRTWNHLGLEGTERIHRIIIHPGDPDVVWVAAMGREWGENEERGIYKTTDGGASWERVLYVNERTGAADLVLDPANPDKLFAAMWEYRRWPWFFKSGGPGSGLHVSRDGGDTWARLTPEDGLPEGELGRIGLGIAASDPRIVYAYIEAEENALYRSEDGGISWVAVGKGDNVGNRPFYYADIRVDPERADRVYSLWSVISVSDDGGRNFRQLVGWDIHPDHHAMWINPEDAAHLIIGNDGGVAISHDRGRTWRFVRNLPLAQFYHIRVDMERPYNIYGGMQDNGSWKGPSTVLENGGIRNFHWAEVGFGDGFDTAADPADPMRGYAMSQEGFLIRWDLRTGERQDIRPAPREGEALRFNWNAGFAQDPFDDATIYYGSQFVHRSRDRGTSWEIISEDLTTNNPEWQNQAESGGLTPDVTGAENFTSIVSIAPSPVAEGVLWVGTDDGRLHVTRDGGVTWSSLEDNVPDVPRNTWIPHIEPSRTDAAGAFVVFDDHRRSNWTPYVFRTDDFGRRWDSVVDSGDVWGYALAVAQDPVDPDLLFLGTEFGLWVSTDGGDGWFKWTHGVPTVGVRDLVVHPRDHDLVLGTHGRAAFVLDDISPLRQLEASTLTSALHVFAIPDAVQYWRRQTGASRFPGHGEFRGQTRPIGALVSVVVNGEDVPHPDEATERARLQLERSRSAGQESGNEEGESGDGEPESVDSIELQVSDAEGNVVRIWEESVHRGLNRITWNLRRDDFRRPDTGGGEGSESEYMPSGIRVLPGDYTLTVRFGELEETVPVTVVPDPRETASDDDRKRKYDALLEAGALRESVADAISAIYRLRTDLQAALAAYERVRDEDGADGEGGGEEVEEEGLESQAREIRRALGSIEERLWVPEGTKGIVYSDDRVWNMVGYALGSMQSSWEAPTAAQMAYLESARAAAANVLSDLAELNGGAVAEFRSAVLDAGLRLMPPQDTPTVD